MSLKSNIYNLVSSISDKLNQLRNWANGEFSAIYNVQQTTLDNIVDLEATKQRKLIPDGSIYINQETNHIGANLSTYQEEFTWNTGDDKVFNTAVDLTYITGVYIGGRRLTDKEYAFTSPNQVTTGSLVNDYTDGVIVAITGERFNAQGLTPYYSKIEADVKNQQTFNEIKQVTEAISAGEGGKLYDTLSDAQAEDPKPVDGTVFTVSKKTDLINAGYHSFQSSEPNGTRLDREFPVEGFERVKKNIWDGTFKDAVLTGVTGSMNYSSNISGRSIIVKINETAEYSISKNEITDRFRIAIFDNYPQNGDESESSVELDAQLLEYQINIASQKYLVVYLSTTTEVPSEIQVEKGGEATTYVAPNSFEIKLKNLGDKIFNHTTVDFEGFKINKEQASFVLRNPNQLFDGEYINNLIVSGATSDNFSIMTEYDIVSFIFPVELGKSYTIRKSQSDRFRVATTASYPSNGQGALRGFNGGNSEKLTFTAETNETYAIVYLSTSLIQPDSFSVNVDNEDYEEPKYILDPENFGEKGQQSIPENLSYQNIDFEGFKINKEQAEFIISNPNQIFQGEFILDKILGGSTADTFNYIDYSGGVSFVFSLILGHTYTIRKSLETNRYRVSLFDSDPVNGNNVRGINSNNGFERVSFRAGVGEEYCVVSVSSTGEIPEHFSVSVNNEDYEEKPKIINPELIPFKNYFSKNFIYDGSVNEEFSSTQSYFDKNNFQTHQDVYAHYDQLMNLHPNYITKQKLGENSIGDEIWQYNFIPHSSNPYSNDPDYVKLLQFNTHSYEREALMSVIRFYTELCENWNSSEVLRYFRWNVQFSVIPMVNPYGFDELVRTNPNGVDINRNADYNWEYANPGTDTFSGDSAGSEIESQIISNFVMSNLDALFLLDFHNYTTNEYKAWFGSSENYNINVMTKMFANSYTGKIYRDYGDILTEKDISRISLRDTDRIGNYHGLVVQDTQNKGVPSVILEVADSFGGSSNAEKQQFSTDLFGNFILHILKCADKLDYFKQIKH